MTQHNIVGSEAIDKPGRRLVAFSHAHGSIVELRRRGRFPALPLLAFAAGVVATIAAALIFGQS